MHGGERFNTVLPTVPGFKTRGKPGILTAKPVMIPTGEATQQEVEVCGQKAHGGSH